MRYTVLLAAALPVLLTASLPIMPAAQEDDLKFLTIDGKQCGPEGTAISAPMKLLDTDKNRFSKPAETDIDPEVSLPAMLAPGKDKNRFDQKKAAMIRGFVVDVRSGGKETCNCRAEDPQFWDTHIELGLAAGVPGTQRVIVEVTPRMRMLMAKQSQDWSTKTLDKTIKGRWVEVTGWLLFDALHVKEAENTNPGNGTNWRATCWTNSVATSS